CARRLKASPGTDGPAANQSSNPGPVGSGMPSAIGRSPAKSAITTERPTRKAPSANVAATTVVPLPPFTDQHAVSMRTPQKLGTTSRGGSGEEFTTKSRAPHWHKRQNMERCDDGGGVLRPRQDRHREGVDGRVRTRLLSRRNDFAANDRARDLRPLRVPT